MTDQVELRPFRAADRSGFERLVRDVHAEFGFAFDPVLDADLADPIGAHDHVWVLARGSEIVGSAALRRVDVETAELKRLYLQPELRGLGWGHTLVVRAIDAARADRCRVLVLDTTVRQESAVRLFESAGFELRERRGDVLIFTLALDALTH